MLEHLPIYMALLTVLGTVISFVIGLLKWLDQRRREQQDKNHEAFHKMITIASGVTEDGAPAKMPQQVAAIYQLQLYKEYGFAAIPILRMLQEDFSDPRYDQAKGKYLLEAIQNTLDVLSSHEAE